MEKDNTILVLNNTSSPSRVIDFIKVGATMGYERFALTKIYGAAAQSGVPEAFKYSYKNGLSLLVFQSLEDFVETVAPDKLLLFAGSGRNLGDIEVSKGDRLALVFDGSEAGFDPLEKKLGEPVYITDIPGRLPVIAEVSLSLYILGKMMGADS